MGSEENHEVNALEMTEQLQEHELLVQWNDFDECLVKAFQQLNEPNERTTADVTLSVLGKSFKVHRMVLCACSYYFRNLLMDPSITLANPSFIIVGVPVNHVEAIIDFMYMGQVSILQNDIEKFLQSAERLGIKGLTMVPPPDQSQ